MYPNKTLTRLAFACWLAVVPLAMLATDPSWAQGNTTAPVNLKQAFDEAWLRQPEAQSLNQLREAAQARRDVAESWVAETPSLEAEANQGGEEYVAGVALPMWLPGERSRTGALAQAESSAVNSRAAAAQLRTAAVVRSAWWSWQLARDDQVLAKKRFSNTQRLAADVARRVNAGDLARADQHQADGAAAMAEFALFESNSVLAATAQNLRALTGYFPANQAVNSSEPLPVIPVDFSSLDASHPAVRELFDQAEVARRATDLAKAQSGSNPVLFIGTSRQPGDVSGTWNQSVNVGVSIPFGASSRNKLRVATAQAQAIETEGLWRLERERLVASLDSARLRVEAARQQKTAADKRARLARESRGFFEKSFRMGETDLPTRLRIELEAVEAERQAARIRIELAAAISDLRQSLGLLPAQN